MSVTLSDLLSHPALAGASLTPRDADGDVVVDSLIPAGGDDSVDGPYLLACAGAAPADVPAGCAAVLARTADTDVGVPTILLPPETPWSAVLGAVAEALGAAGGLAAAARARGALRQMATVEATADDVATLAAGLLGAPVALLDEYLNVLGAAELSLDQRAELQGAIEGARGHGPVSLAGRGRALDHPTHRGGLRCRRPALLM